MIASNRTTEFYELSTTRDSSDHEFYRRVKASASGPDPEAIHERIHYRGLRLETGTERHTLDIADVYHVLAYYHDHSAEMQEVEV
jgi:hypothetical protein